MVDNALHGIDDGLAVPERAYTDKMLATGTKTGSRGGHHMARLEQQVEE